MEESQRITGEDSNKRRKNSDTRLSDSQDSCKNNVNNRRSERNRNDSSYDTGNKGQELGGCDGSDFDGRGKNENSPKCS